MTKELKAEHAKLAAMQIEQEAKQAIDKARFKAYQIYNYINANQSLKATFQLECNMVDDAIVVITKGLKNIIRLNEKDALDKLNAVWQELTKLQNKMPGNKL